MKIMIISSDSQVIHILRNSQQILQESLIVFSETQDPLDVMSLVCSANPTILIADDDFLSPNSAHILRSVRKVNEKVKIIFLTSDDSVKLGREISPLKIHFYGHKPIADNDLLDSIQSITYTQTQTSTN